MSATWIVGLLAVLAAVVSRLTWFHRHSRQSDLGVVSQQWIAEQRLAQKQDSQR